MLKSFFTIVLSVLILTSCGEEKKMYTQLEVKSPNKKLKLYFQTLDEGLFYTVVFKKDTIIRPSKMGFELKNKSALNNGFEILGFREDKYKQDWEQVWGENKTVTNYYHELVVELKEKDSLERRMNISFRLFNDGLGFSYEIPKQKGMDSVIITNELTAFNLGGDYITWFTPANYDSYEMLYENKAASRVESANTPVTFESVDQKLFISIHEANLTDYAGMTLKKEEGTPLNFEADLVPWPDGTKVKTVAGMSTPWRTIQVSESAAGLMESSLILNLNAPNELEDVSWVKPTKYVGIWWGMHLGTETWMEGVRHGATTENIKKYIDFAAEYNFQSVLAEGWSTGWEDWGKPKAFDFTTPYKDFNLEEIVDYADEKGIDLIGHHETGGDVYFYEARMDTAFALYHALGVHHLKTGYAGSIVPGGQYHHGQYMVNHYRKVIETAAKYEITINAHEPIKPTGIRRTFPNMMSREGARGMEWNAWSDGNPPEHHTILPFTRILAGPLDYTPGIFDLLYENAGERVKWNGLDKGTSRINTTLSKQLALYVVFYSPLQMAADLVGNYENQPAFKFIQDVPVNWEYTKVLAAKIGDYVVVTRKDIASDDWYLGAVTDEESRTIKIELNFLDSDKRYRAEIYQDTESTDWKSNPYPIEMIKKEVTANEEMFLKLAPGGGQAIRFYVLE